MILETTSLALASLVGVHVYRSHTAHQDFIGDLTGAMWSIVSGKKGDNSMLWPSRKTPNYIQSHPADIAVDTRRFGTPQGRLDSIATVIGPKKTEPYLQREPEPAEPAWLGANEVEDNFNAVDF